jgi:hypothetical protein
MYMTIFILGNAVQKTGIAPVSWRPLDEQNSPSLERTMPSVTVGEDVMHNE